MTVEPRLIDSNVLAYAYDDDPHKSADALDVVEDAFQNGWGVVSGQNLAEFSRVVMEKFHKPIALERVRTITRQFVKLYRVLPYSGATVLAAQDLMAAHGIHFFDALLAATMQEHGIQTIVTENEKDFRKIPGLNVINPFKPASTSRAK